jgi:rod shape determining protein RodA
MSLGHRWRDFDKFMFFTTVVLMGFGVVAIWSATGMEALSISNLGVRQAFYGVFGLITMFVLAAFDYRFLATGAWLLYLIGIAGLVAVLVPQIGTDIGGARRWIFIGGLSLQPAEFAKLSTIIALAAFVASRGQAMEEIGNFIVSLLIVALPMGMVFLEPDLGTSLVYGAIWVSIMLLAARTRLFYFGAMALLAVPAFVFAWRFVFHDYQKTRLLVSYRPELDPLGEGFNIVQARISIGSGGWFGAGLAGGTQSQLELLKVRESDFIFAHVSGMFGFFGMLALMLSYLILLWRCFNVIESARDNFGQCLAAGISGALFFQAIVNIGMNEGLLPVTGITLPFVSAGSSSVWTFLMAEGILQSVLMHRRKLAFQAG